MLFVLVFYMVFGQFSMGSWPFEVRFHKKSLFLLMKIKKKKFYKVVVRWTPKLNVFSLFFFSFLWNLSQQQVHILLMHYNWSFNSNSNNQKHLTLHNLNIYLHYFHMLEFLKSLPLWKGARRLPRCVCRQVAAKRKGCAICKSFRQFCSFHSAPILLAKPFSKILNRRN